MVRLKLRLKIDLDRPARSDVDLQNVADDLAALALAFNDLQSGSCEGVVDQMLPWRDRVLALGEELERDPHYRKLAEKRRHTECLDLHIDGKLGRFTDSARVWYAHDVWKHYVQAGPGRFGRWWRLPER